MFSKFPVVTLLGPRQAGKTTLVRLAFPNMSYVNLEDAENRSFATEDPKGFIETYPNGAIFDEVQRVPHLLSYIQVKVDEKGKNGMYVLTGSHQAALHSAVSQSLAGRTSLLKLLPLSLQEIESAHISGTIDSFILKGGYPRVYKEDLPLNNAYSSYFQTYVERDVRQILQIKEIMLFERFIKLVASRIGQVVNFSSLAADVGVSATTIKEWLSVLEATYVLFRLEPYYENFGKRLIKSPKIFFSDTGLACFLLGIENEDQLKRDSLYGNLFENFVILELMKAKYNKAEEPHFYFYRDVTGKEVDLLVQKGSQLFPIEIKSGKTFSSSYLKNLKYLQSQIPEKVKKGAIIYAGDKSQKVKEFELVNVSNFTKILESEI